MVNPINLEIIEHRYSEWQAWESEILSPKVIASEDMVEYLYTTLEPFIEDLEKTRNPLCCELAARLSLLQDKFLVSEDIEIECEEISRSFRKTRGDFATAPRGQEGIRCHVPITALVAPILCPASASSSSSSASASSSLVFASSSSSAASSSSSVVVSSSSAAVVASSSSVAASSSSSSAAPSSSSATPQGRAASTAIVSTSFSSSSELDVIRGYYNRWQKILSGLSSAKQEPSKEAVAYFFDDQILLLINDLKNSENQAYRKLGQSLLCLQAELYNVEGDVRLLYCQEVEKYFSEILKKSPSFISQRSGVIVGDISSITSSNEMGKVIFGARAETSTTSFGSSNPADHTLVVKPECDIILQNLLSAGAFDNLHSVLKTIRGEDPIWKLLANHVKSEMYIQFCLRQKNTSVPKLLIQNMTPDAKRDGIINYFVTSHYFRVEDFSGAKQYLEMIQDPSLKNKLREEISVGESTKVTSSSPPSSSSSSKEASQLVDPKVPASPASLSSTPSSGIGKTSEASSINTQDIFVNSSISSVIESSEDLETKRAILESFDFEDLDFEIARVFVDYISKNQLENAQEAILLIRNPSLQMSAMGILEAAKTVSTSLPSRSTKRKQNDRLEQEQQKVGRVQEEVKEREVKERERKEENEPATL